ncbi:MAG: hypothetical protein RIA69_09215 [Cyclobacteriaceae bacterium]
MNKLLGLIFVILSFTWTSCDDENTALTRNRYFDNAQLNDDMQSVVIGNNLVFHHYYQAADQENIADDEFEENIFFEIPSPSNAFELKDSDLSHLKFSYQYVCFCMHIDSVMITNGTISGKKDGNQWQVDVDVTLRPYYQYDADSTVLGDPFPKSFSGKFSAGSLK